MSLAERVHEILPRVREAARLADEAAQADQAFWSMPRASQFVDLELYETSVKFAELGNLPTDNLKQPEVSIDDSERQELEAAHRAANDKCEECKKALDELRPNVNGLRKQEFGKLPQSTLDEVTEVISLCIHIERISADQYWWLLSTAQPAIEREQLVQPWVACAIGQLLLEVLPRAPTEELKIAAGDWVRLVASKFLPVLSSRLEGEDSTLAEQVSDLATRLCVEAKCTSPEVLLAFDQIAERLDDSAILRARIQPLLLFALENTPAVTSATFVRLVARIARSLFNGDEHRDQWPRFAKLLWSHGIGGSFNTRDFILETCSGGENDNDPDQWPEGWRRDVIAFASSLSAAFWLSRVYRKLGDEGRELFCSYFYQTENHWGPDTWKKLGIEFGWADAEEEEQRQRLYKELFPRFGTSTPWPLTSVIPRVEITPAQIESVAEAAAAKTISTLVSGGSLSEIVSADVEPHLRQEVGEETWAKLPQDAQRTLTAASFIWKVQPARFDCSGAAVMDWKTLEIALGRFVFDDVWAKLDAGARASYERFGKIITIGNKLYYLANAIEGKFGQLERGLREALKQKDSSLLEEEGFRSVFHEPLAIRNKATHDEPVSRAEFERSRSFVFEFLRLLYRKSSSRNGNHT